MRLGRAAAGGHAPSPMSGRPLKFADLVLYTLAMMLSVRWPAATAVIGPVAPLMWLAAMATFLVPVVLVTAELVGRYPGAGGLYDWSRQAFGPFAGFMCGWLYWASTLPFFSGMLVFLVATTGGALGGGAQAALASTPGYLAASLLVALGVTGLHLRGIGVGKWLSNAGAAGACGLFALMILGGLAAALTRGPATDFAHASYAPPLNWQGAALWSIMTLAFVGPEATAFLTDDVEGGVRTVLRALLAVGVLTAGAYGLATLGLLAILPTEKLSRLDGLSDALRALAAAGGAPAAGPWLLALVAFIILGGYAAWFGLAARVPFAAGVDEALPRAFARRDPRTGAPTTAIWVQTAVVIALILLGAIGSTMKAAYDFLVAMTVLSAVLPYLFIFAAHLKVGPPPAGAGWRIPGGRPAGVAVSIVGLLATVSAIVCSAAPSPDAPDKLGAVLKVVAAGVVMVAAGAAAYGLSRLARRATLRPSR